MWKFIAYVSLSLALTIPDVRYRSHDMAEHKEPWFQLTPGECGEPYYVHSSAHSRVQRQFLRYVSNYNQPDEIEELERELNGSLSGVEKLPCGYGVSNDGGSDGFSFKGDGLAVVWFEYDNEAEGADRYPVPARELSMPMEEAEPLFRAWIASVRHWRALADKYGTPLPVEVRPTVYPPPPAKD